MLDDLSDTFDDPELDTDWHLVPEPADGQEVDERLLAYRNRLAVVTKPYRFTAAERRLDLSEDDIVVQHERIYQRIKKQRLRSLGRLRSLLREAFRADASEGMVSTLMVNNEPSSKERG